jgi:hypothetical protein
VVGTSGGACGEQAQLQEKDVREKGSALTSAIRIGAALVGTLIFVVAEPTELPARDPTPTRPVFVEVERAKGDDLPGSEPDESVTPGRARRVVEDRAEVGRRALQDHDDVEESDRDRSDRESDDGSVVNGDFEGSSVARGHNITSSNSSAPEDEGDD